MNQIDAENTMNQYDVFGEQVAYSEVVELNNPTFTEAWALVEAAQRMASHLESGTLGDPQNLENLLEAIRLNSNLWAIFQTELRNERGAMPANIRDNMLSLCNHVGTHSIDTLSEPTVERVITLIDINRQVANCLLESLQIAIDMAEAQVQPKEALEGQT